MPQPVLLSSLVCRQTPLDGGVLREASPGPSVWGQTPRQALAVVMQGSSVTRAVPRPQAGRGGAQAPPGSVPDSHLHLWSSSCSSSSACALQATALAPPGSCFYTHTFISFNLSAEINFSIPLIILFLFTFELSPICLLWPGNEVPPDEMLYSACDLARVV